MCGHIQKGLSLTAMYLPAIFKFETMTELNARAALSWRYEPPYDFYNHDPAELDKLIYNSFLNTAYHYHAVIDEHGPLIAFRCSGKDAQVPGGDYSAETLDMVCAIDVFFGVGEPTGFLRQICQITKPEGFLIIDDGHQSCQKTLQ